MRNPFELDTEKVWPNAKYVVVGGWYDNADKEIWDKHPYCLGIYDSFDKALGVGYSHLNMISQAWPNLKKNLPILESLEDDAGWMMCYHDDNPEADDTTYNYILILLKEEDE